MQYELAEKMKECLEDFGQRAEIHEGYSGKFMYGRKTTGIVTHLDLTAILTCVITNPMPFINEVSGEPLFDEIRDFSIDNMGLDKIVY